LFETVSACMAKHGFHTCDNGSLGSPTTMRRVVADAVDALCESNSQALVQMCRALGYAPTRSAGCQSRTASGSSRPARRSASAT
jgi:hypothetical protein